MEEKSIHQLVDHLFRKQYGKMVAVLVNKYGFDQVEAVEDLVQDTLVEAMQRWSYGSIPENPEGWLMQVAKNKAVNHLKREQIQRRAAEQIQLTQEPSTLLPDYDSEIEDSMLRMIFASCHPFISGEDQVALVLKILCGFSTREIAKALLLGEEAVAKRIYRARQEIVKQKIELELPGGEDLANRLDTVCTCLYLLFNEGYNSRNAEELIRKDLCLESIRLCKLLTNHFKEHTKVHALLSLLCFHTARFESRLDDKGAIVVFEDQDRSLWDRNLIQSGFYYLSEASKGEELTVYHLEASIAAQHCSAPSLEKTNWAFIKILYEKLYDLKPSPVILLNLGIISGWLEGATAAIQELEQLLEEKRLKQNHLLYASLGEFNAQLKKEKEASKWFSKALSLTNSESERHLLQEKIDRLSA